MRIIETITTAKDILALVDYVCSQRTDIEYKLCAEHEIKLEYSFPIEAPKWIVPITFCHLNRRDKYRTKYFIFDHEFCSLTVQNAEPNQTITYSAKLTDLDAWISHFHYWIINDEVVKTVFTIIHDAKPIYLPDHWVSRCFNEHQHPCQVLFLTPDDVMNGFPFREIVKQVKNIELKVTSYNEPVWLLTQNTGKKYVIYPCSLHRFCDELNVSHDFDGELRRPQKNEEFLVSHFVSHGIYPVIAFKAKNEQELSILRFSEMNLKHKMNFTNLNL